MIPASDHSLIEALLCLSSDEIYVLDAHSFALLRISEQASKRWNKSVAALKKMPLPQLIGIDKKTLAALATELQDTVKWLPFNQLTACRIKSADGDYLVFINSTRSDYSMQSDEDSRFHALVSNTPGLVFEFKLDSRGEIKFGYLSDACKALLGVDPDDLRNAPKNFYKRLDITDRARLRKSLRFSASELKLLNWEGRLWIEEWKDNKWINIRATPRKLEHGAVLWEGIMSNITQSKLEKFELEASRRRLADLSAHMERIKEEERARISREIHDDLGGNLTAIKIALASIIKRLSSDQPILLEKVMSLETIVDQTFEAAHRISGDLRPTVLSLGISAALEWQATEFSKRMDIPCHFTTNMMESTETEEQATTLFRVCQEALSNIAKYADAKRVDIALFFAKNDIKMYVTDDGIGIENADKFKPNSFGLRGMQERVFALGGSFSIEKAGDRGTNVMVLLPRHLHTES